MGPKDDDTDSAPTSELLPCDDSRADKAQLQRRMDEARASISQTVEEIKETVEGQYTTAKETLGGILDWRDKFQQDPIVWSVGALSAGFALGYTLGRAEKSGALGDKHSGVGAFADTLVRELTVLGTHLPMAEIDPTVKRVLGFDLSQLFAEVSAAKRRRPRRKTARATKRKKASR